MTVERGFYRHYKGSIYWVHGIAENHDGGPDIVVYESLQGVEKTPQRMCYRTVAEFTETITEPVLPGDVVFQRVSYPRFERVGTPKNTESFEIGPTVRRR